MSALDSILNACESEFLLIKDQISSEDCSEILNKGGFKVLGQDCSNGFLLKVEFSSFSSPKSFLAFLKNSELRPKWDKNVEKIVIIEVSSQVYITYTKFKKILGVSQRDMVIISKEIETGEGMMVVSTSFNHSDFPESQDTTRIKIDIAGYYLKTTEAGSQVFHITQANFGGILPQKFMKNAVAMSMPKFHSEMEAAMKRNSTKETNFNTS